MTNNIINLIRELNFLTLQIKDMLLNFYPLLFLALVFSFILGIAFTLALVSILKPINIFVYSMETL
jgi:hypothetical protein